MIFNINTPPDGIREIADGAVTVSKLNSDVTTFTEAATRTNIASGDSITTLWGKIKKWFTDLKAIAFSGSYTDVTGLTDSTGQLDIDSISANSADISGWDISGQRLFHEGIYTLNPDKVDDQLPTAVYFGGGTNANQDVIVVRTGEQGSYSYPFYVRANGVLHAGNIDASGTTTAAGFISTVNFLVSNPTNGVHVQLTSNNAGAQGLLSNGYCNSSGTFVADSQWMLYRNSSGTLSIPMTITGLTTTGVIKKTTSGDVVSCEMTSASGMQYRLKNSVRNGAMHLNSAGTLGLYDDTNSSWIIFSETNGNVSIPHQLSIGNLVVNKGANSARNMISITSTSTTVDASYHLKNGLREGMLIISGGNNFGLFDITNNNYVIYSNSSQQVVSPHELVVNSIKSSGTIAAGSNASGATGAVHAISANRNIALHSNAAGNAGIYDAGHSAWILRSDSSQNINIPHNAYFSGDYLYLGTIAATNSPNIICANNKNNVALSCTQSSAGVYHHNGSGASAKWLIYISTSGTVTANTSDIRYKNIYGNIDEYETLTMLRGLDVINFSYKEDEKGIVQNGFKAQQMRDLLKSSGIGYRPYLDIQDMTCEEPLPLYDLDAPEGNVVYGVDYSRLTPLLVSGWQIHDTEIAELKAEIAELKAKLNQNGEL